MYDAHNPLMEIVAHEKTVVDGDTLMGNSCERLIGMFRKGYGISAHLRTTRDGGMVTACEPDLSTISHGTSRQLISDTDLDEIINTAWGGHHVASLNDILATAKMYGGRTRPQVPLSDVIMLHIEDIKEADQWGVILEKVSGMYSKKTILCAPEKTARYLREKSAAIHLCCPFTLLATLNTNEIKKLGQIYNWVYVEDTEADEKVFATLRKNGFRIILASEKARDEAHLKELVRSSPDLLCTTEPQKVRAILARRHASHPWQNMLKKTLSGLSLRKIKLVFASLRYKAFRRILTMYERRTGRIISFHTRPLYAKDITLVADPLVHTPSIAIVLQGPLLKKYDFTLETIRIYRQVYRGLTIIVSTWEDEDQKYLERIRRENVEIVLNKKPAYNGPLNVNMQITSARNGIARAKELGIPYVIKSRTDHRMYNKNILESLYDLIQYFPPSERSKQKKRIIFGHNCPKYQPYYFSDIFMFGDTDDVLEYWNTDLIEKGPEYPIFSAEIFLASSYLKRKGWPMVWTMQATWDIYQECIITIDWQEIELFWLKYDYFWERDIGRHRDRYSQQYMPTPDFLTFHEWFNVYSNRENKILSLKNEGFIRLLPPKEPLP